MIVWNIAYAIAMIAPPILTAWLIGRRVRVNKPWTAETWLDCFAPFMLLAWFFSVYGFACWNGWATP